MLLDTSFRLQLGLAVLVLAMLDAIQLGYACLSYAGCYSAGLC